jgi:hypothetical protein
MLAVSSRSVTPGPANVDGDQWYRVTPFMGDPMLEKNPDALGFVVEAAPAEPEVGDRFATVKPHFHLVRQFQVIIDGDEPQVAKTPVAPFDLQYVDPSTPYGPFMTGKKGLTFMTLRPPGAHKGLYWMPGSRDRMTKRAGRNLLISLADHDSGAPLDTLIERHEDGLAAFRANAEAGELLGMPDPAGAGGQHLLVIRGSVVHEGAEYPAMSLLWVDPDEGPAELAAGADGASVLVMQYPLRNPAAEPFGLDT